MKISSGLKVTALVLMGLVALLFSFMGIGEMLGGDLSGAIHLPPVALIALMMWFGWKKPLAGGATMFGLGILISIFFLIVTTQTDRMIAILLMGGPFLLPGMLFILAALLEKQRHAQGI